MAATQKRWLTQHNSKVGKVPDLPAVLRRAEAWNSLDRETRQALYNCLPAVQDGEAPRDIDVHPLKTSLKPYIEESIRQWQIDLNDEKESKKWRQNAFRAAHERSSGAWDQYREQQREADWGKRETTEPPLHNAVMKEEASTSATANVTTQDS